MARSRPWWKHCRWKVEAKTPSGWKEIYCAETRKSAQQDAKDWSHKTGQKTLVSPGEGHPKVRQR